jgi:glycine/D-amino acid oxidase-like deaminating enzyme
VLQDAKGDVSSVRLALGDSLTSIDIPCTRIIIAAGAWSPRVFEELFPKSRQPKLPISSLAGHSLVVTSPRWTAEFEGKGCHAVFTTSRSGFSPEIFSRLGGHIYIAGLNSSAIPLPSLPGEQRPDSSALAQLKETATALLGSDADPDDLKVVREGLCFRPVSPGGSPIIDRIDDRHLGVGVSTRPGADGGVFLAAGHGPWGISLSLGTGCVLAELAQGRRLSADIAGLKLQWGQST